MKLLLRLLPRNRMEFGKALLNEAEQDRNAGKFRFGGVSFVANSWFDWMIEGNLMKTIVTTLSVVNALMGLFLVGLYFLTNDNPINLALIALAILIQGVFTLLYVSRALNRLEPWSTRLLLAGSSVALLIGGLGFVAATLNNLLRPPPGADPEFGPLVVAAMVATHAAATVYTFAIRRPENSVASQ